MGDDRCRGGIVEWSRRCVGVPWTECQERILEGLGGGELLGDVWGDVGKVEPSKRQTCSGRAGRGGGKTTICSTYSLWRAMTCDLSEAGGGAEVVIPIIAPTAPAARLMLGMAIHFAMREPLRDCVKTLGNEEGRRKNAVTSTSLHLVRPNDGREVEIRAVVAGPGGRGLVGYHIPSAVIDEAERMRVDSEAGITDREQIDAIRPRLLPGGSIVMISTPYDLESYMHTHVERNFGHPVDGISFVATTRRMRPDSPMMGEMVTNALLVDPALAMRDYECIPLGRPDSYFAPIMVDGCVITIAQRQNSRVSAACDLAFVNDGCALVVIERQDNRLVQVYERFIQPTPAQPLRPSEVRSEFLNTIKAHNCNTCAADVHEWSSLCEVLIPAGIQVMHAPVAQSSVTAFALTRDLMRSGKLSVLPETARQLKRVTTSPDGSPKLPRTAGEGHSDLVSALAAAVWLDRRHGPLDGGGGGSFGTLRGAWVT
jgi:hypothetical protein